jgi:hypothetical protein
MVCSWNGDWTNFEACTAGGAAIQVHIARLIAKLDSVIAKFSLTALDTRICPDSNVGVTENFH